jgi:hypothetical protein
MSPTAAASESEAVVSCFEDVEVMSEAVEERGRHLCVTEDTMVPWQRWRQEADSPDAQAGGIITVV